MIAGANARVSEVQSPTKNEKEIFSTQLLRGK